MKKRLYPFVYLVLGMFLFPLTACHNMQIQKNITQGIPIPETKNIAFQKSWKRWDKPQSIRLYDYKIKGVESIQGIPCVNKITIDSLGKPYSFTLGKDYVLNGTWLPKGSRYERRLGRNNQEIGYMIFLSGPCEIQGYHVRDKAGLEDYKIDFYRDGRLKDFKLFEDKEIMGMWCKGNIKSDISLYPNGNLWICTLAKGTVSDEQEYLKGTKIVLDQNGKAYSYTLEKHLEIMKALGVY